MRIVPEQYESPDALALRAEYRSELAERYGRDPNAGVSADAGDVAAFVVARGDAGELLGCGGLHSPGEPVVEIREMFVRPEARGRGVGAAILEALEQEATRLGFKVVRLEAGPLQPEAIGLYARAGYREIPCFGGSGGPGSRCFERRL